MVLSVPIRVRAGAAVPNPRRIAAWSAALAAHLAVVLLLLLPRMPLPVDRPDVPPDPPIVWIEPVPVVVAALPAPAEPRPRQVARALAMTPELPVPVVEPTPLSLPAPEIEAAFEAPAGMAPAQSGRGPAGASQAIAIDTVTAPPYPGPALRRGLQGTVLLRVLIGVDGRPLAVHFERRSGHRELDRAAREHVLAHWRFHPALRNGRPVQASARVPIVFRLR